MPNKHYLRKKRKIPKTYNIKPTGLVVNTGPQFSLRYTLSARDCDQNIIIQNYLLDMVDIIGQRLDITEINQRALYIMNTLTTPIALFNLLDDVEQLSYSIVENVTDGTDINIICRRIDYLRQLIDKLPPNAQKDYSSFGATIIEILNMITNGIDFSIVNQNLSTISTTLQKDARELQLINDIQDTFCSIIQNITDAVDISVIAQRISYVRTLIQRLTC